MKLAIVVLIACTGIADAQPTSEADRLFREGLALFDAGKFDDACAKFEQSILKDPHAIGTLMNLGRCNERLGKVGTALKRFQEAYDRASQADAVAMRDAAQERIAALVTQVPVVTLHRAGAPLDGEKLVIDNDVIPGTAKELRLDPGSHAIVLTAPGRLPFETTFTVAIKSTMTLELPELEVPKPGSTVRIRSGTRRVVGKISAFSGAAVAVAAAGLAVYAKRDYDAQFEDPDGAGPGLPSCSGAACNQDGHARTERDRTIETSALVIGAIGLAATATGAVLWLTSPAEHQMIVPTGSASTVGVAVIGRF